MSQTGGSTREVGRGKDTLVSEGWGARRRRSGVTGQSGIRRMGGAKEMEARTFDKISLPMRGTRQVGITKNE